MSVKSPANFAAQILLPALALGLALSAGVNVVLFATRGQAGTRVPAASSSSAAAALPEQLPPGGFGSVGQGLRKLEQRVEGIPAGVYRYALPKDMLPALPPTMTLYRDQGVTADASPFNAILAGMNVPLDPSLRLLPRDITFSTRDNVYTILVNVRDRTLEVSRTEQSPQDVSDVPVSPPLPDDRLIAIAKQMAGELGIDTAALGEPSVVKIYRTVEAGSAGKVLAPGIEEVRWPLKFGSYPVVDEVGRPVSAMAVFVGHRSQQALALNMHVLSPALLSSSEYKTAEPTVMTGLALAGGLAPIDGDEKGKAVTITYQSATLAYMLPTYQSDRPTYVVPVIRLASDIIRTCKVQPCTPWTWTTIVPAVDPEAFAWAPRASSSAAMSSSQAAVSSAPASSARSSSASSSKPASSAASSAKPAAVSSSAAPKPASSSAPGNALDGLQILR